MIPNVFYILGIKRLAIIALCECIIATEAMTMPEPDVQLASIEGDSTTTEGVTEARR